MGRKRKNNPLNLPARVYAHHGAFFYVHLSGKWERIGTDVVEARVRCDLYNDPEGVYDTMAYYLDQFVLHCKKRVGLPKAAACPNVPTKTTKTTSSR
jgi:hypothetical protein